MNIAKERVSDDRSWLQKYTPDRLSQMNGNSEAAKQLSKFIRCFKKGVDPSGPSVLVIGGVGKGKSLITILAAKKHNFEVINFDVQHIECNLPKGCTVNKAVGMYYDRIYENQTICPMTHKLIKTKSVLVIENLETVTSTGKEKDYIKALVKLNTSRRQLPIILVANDNHCKLVNVIKKLAYHEQNGRRHPHMISVTGMTVQQQYKLIKHVLQSENVDIKVDEVYLCGVLIEYSQNDIRRLLNSIEAVVKYSTVDKIDENNLSITLNNIVKFQSVFCGKHMNPGITERTLGLMSNYSGMQDTLNAYQEKKADIPLILHENYMTHIAACYKTKTKLEQLEMMANTSHSISVSDMVDGIIYNSQAWEMMPVHGFFGCVMPSYYLSSLPDKKFTDHGMAYTDDYNKTSTQKSNIKKMQLVRKDIGPYRNASIIDISSSIGIICKLMCSERYSDVVDMFWPHIVTFNDLKSVIKLNTIQTIKLNIKTEAAYNLAIDNKRKSI